MLNFRGIKDTEFVKAYVLIVYFVLVGILAIYAFSPFSGEVGYILARLTPHLVYIPLVLTALWYPQQKLAHVLIFSLIFVLFIAGYMIGGWNMDLIFNIFTSFIYLWVYFAILLIPSWDTGRERKELRSLLSRTRVNKKAENPKILKKTSYVEINTADSSENVREVPCNTPLPEFRQVPPERILPLIESFRIADSDVLANTFRAIESIGSPAEPYLITALESSHIPVRENSAKMLGILKSSDAICSLIEAMNDRSKRVRNAGIQALAKIGEPSVAPLYDALGDGRWNIRAGSCVALRVIGVKGAIPGIIPLLFDENHYVRKEAAKSLGRLGDDDVLKYLHQAVCDESRGVRLAVVSALGKIKNEDSVPYLFSLLKEEKDCQVRERIIESLGLIGGEMAITAIKYATLDPDPEIKALAKEYLFGFNCQT